MSEMLRTSGYMSNQRPLPNANLEDLLKCVICYDKLVDAKMCPFCSKLCCKMCIHRWLIENRSQCPHCRASLRLDQLVTCRFLKDITQALENLTMNKTEEVSDKCAVHNCPLNYFCTTCDNPICSDCAMFSTDHKGHEFQHLQSVYKKHVEQINVESKSLSKRVKDLEILLAELDVNIDKFRTAKEEKSRELVLYMEQIQCRLENQLKEKLNILGLNRDKIQDEIRRLRIMQIELEKELSNVAKSKLIAKSAELVKKLKTIQSMPSTKYDSSSVTCDFYSEVIPSYDSGVFILKNFSQIQQTTEVVYSDALHINGLMWRLKVYPNGNGVAKGNYLSVFLELLKGHGESAKYDYRVEMVHQVDPNQSVLREFASDFETGECWGYNRFYHLEQLKSEGFISSEDTLIMNYYVRAPTYYQLHKDQGKYIKQLLEKESSAKEQIENLSKKLEKYGEKNEVFFDYDPDENNQEINDKEENKRTEEDIFKEKVANSPNELSTMMQRYMMSPEEISSDEDLTPKQLNWNEIKDIPDFHSCSELMSQDFPESPDGEEKDFSPLG